MTHRRPGLILLSALLLAAGLAATTSALAQSQNLTEAKCTDALRLEANDQSMLIVWLSGYFSGTLQTPMIDPAAIRNARQALADLCVKSPETKLLGPEARTAILGQPAVRP
jgi:hypothetical protein